MLYETGSSEQRTRRVRAKSREAQKSATTRPHMVDRDIAHSVRVRNDRVPDGRLRIGVLAAGKKIICLALNKKDFQR